MKLTFLGTGAADWVGQPKTGDFRRLCSTRIGDHLLIDGNPEIMDFISDPEAITDILYTHRHGDHYDPKLWPLLPNATPRAGEPLHEKIVTFRDNESFIAGGLKITPLHGNHCPSPVHHFFIEDGEKCIYYALDSAWLLIEESLFLRQKKLDALVIDATIGDGHEGDYRVFEHNSLPMVRIMVDTLRSTGVLRPEAPVFLDHLALTLHPGSEELRASLTPGFIAPNDGETYII